MASEAMGLIENFSGKWIIHEALRCRVADEHEKNGQEGEASDTRPLPILQECSVGEETGHVNRDGLYCRHCCILRQRLDLRTSQKSPIREFIMQLGR